MKKADRQRVFEKYNGRCAYCGTELQKGWHVDHLEPIRRSVTVGGKPMVMAIPRLHSMENWMPSCPSCNINKHSDSLEIFRERISGFTKSLNRDSVQYKVAKRYGLIREIHRPVMFYFEIYESL